MFRHSQKCACQVKGCICCWLYCIYCVVRRVFIIKTNTCNFFFVKEKRNNNDSCKQNVDCMCIMTLNHNEFFFFLFGAMCWTHSVVGWVPFLLLNIAMKMMMMTIMTYQKILKRVWWNFISYSLRWPYTQYFFWKVCWFFRFSSFVHWHHAKINVQRNRMFLVDELFILNGTYFVSRSRLWRKKIEKCAFFAATV